MHEMVIDKDLYDSGAIARRLNLLDLTEQELAIAQQLHDTIIAPNLQHILDHFYSTLSRDREFQTILAQGYVLANLKKTQTQYLLTLGVNFNSAEYFRQRLLIGMAHAKVGVKPSLYQCAYRVLQQLLIELLPLDHPQYAQVLSFILKITMLDMSLAIEAYQDRMTEKLRCSVQALTDEKTNLSEELATDQLTGVLSRRRVLELLEHRIQGLQAPQPISVVMADLDYFKKINDRYGHVVGDIVLRETASRIRSAIRSTNAVGRYGGEEFLIILTETNLEQACVIAERIRLHVSGNPIACGDQLVDLTVSLGIATTTQSEDINTLIDRADKALYKAKAGGRNRVEVAN